MIKAKKSEFQAWPHHCTLELSFFLNILKINKDDIHAQQFTVQYLTFLCCINIIWALKTFWYTFGVTRVCVLPQQKACQVKDVATNNIIIFSLRLKIPWKVCRIIMKTFLGSFGKQRYSCLKLCQQIRVLNLNILNTVELEDVEVFTKL